MEGVVANHFALQTGQNKLNAKEHENDTHKEQWLIVNWPVVKEVTADHHVGINEHTSKEGPEAQWAKEPQGGTHERREKEDVEQVYQAASKASCAELGDAKLTWMVPYFDLCDAKATPLRHYRHKAVKIAIKLEMRILNHFTSIRFEPIVDVMQVDACLGSDQLFEDTSRERFGDRVQTWKFPARNQVIALFQFG